MARSQLPEDTVVRLAQWQRWGVCDEGTADICAVDLKTVHRFQHVAAQRAETHHRQVVHAVDVPGVQLDEAHSKLRPRQVAWIHPALAMGSWLLLWVDGGPRPQEMAATRGTAKRVRTLLKCWRCSCPYAARKLWIAVQLTFQVVCGPTNHCRQWLSRESAKTWGEFRHQRAIQTTR